MSRRSVVKRGKLRRAKRLIWDARVSIAISQLGLRSFDPPGFHPLFAYWGEKFGFGGRG
jgi:hypothetical protein